MLCYNGVVFVQVAVRDDAVWARPAPGRPRTDAADGLDSGASDARRVGRFDDAYDDVGGAMIMWMRTWLMASGRPVAGCCRVAGDAAGTLNRTHLRTVAAATLDMDHCRPRHLLASSPDLRTVAARVSSVGSAATAGLAGQPGTCRT